ncbi:MAG: translation initiation factor IF-2 [bacterium]|nr:translation initiation factor IF-2 [bacterium]
MAKQKVYELAKELGVPSKDLVTLCEQNNIEVKNHMSAISEEQAAMLTSKIKKKTPADAKKESSSVEEKKAEKPVDAEKKTEKPADTAAPSKEKQDAPSAAASEAGSAQKTAPIIGRAERGPAAAPKKKNIIVVSNPHNSKMPGSPQGQRGFGGGPDRRGNGQGRGITMQRPVNRPIRPLTPPSPTPSVNIVANPNKGQDMRRPANRPNPADAADMAENRTREQQGAPNTAPAAQENRNAAAMPETRDHRDSRDNNRGYQQRPGQEYGRGAGSSDRAPMNGQGPRGQGGYNRGDRGDRGGAGRTDGFRGQAKQGGFGGYGTGGQRPAYRQDGARNTDGGGRGGYGRPAPGRQGGYGSQGSQRPYGGNDRFERGGEGKDARFGRKSQGGGSSFAPEASLKDQEKKRDEEKRRIEKDKRNKKELIYEEEQENLKGKRAGRFIKPEKKQEEQEEQIKVITLPESLTIRELADKMKLQPSAIVKKLFLQGKVVTVNQEISYEQAEEIAIEYEIICEKEEKIDVIAELLKEDEENVEDMTKRPPVICVMGHVDHGKTSLLDAIRKTNVIDKEAGGITQAIGAYTVTINDEKITFLDTPGHEAFTAMRMRGANATDIAVLVVAADDGVMPQTIEAINHAKAAGIEIIVAVNKMDKPNANMDRVKQELTEHELIPVDWGGSTEFVPVSAKTGMGISDLLETILLTADILELKANVNRRARGLVIEAQLDKGRGPVATVLVQKGTLQVGDYISAGASSGKVRAMIDDKGRRVKEATPSTPVEILGLNDVPNAGEIFIAHENDKEAKNFAETFVAQNKEKLLEDTKAKMSLDDLFSQIQAGNLKELNIIIKADVQGSVEAVKQSLLKLSNEEVVVKIIHGGVGAINESDVSLASASSAIIIGFNVRPDAQAKMSAEREGVDVRLYKVIYQAIEDVEAAMKGMLDPVFEEKIIGHAEVRQLFKASAIGNIAGSYVMDGYFQRGCKIRITREGEQIYEGELASLKRFKDDVKEVKEGFECGLVFEGFDQMKELDMVEAYIMVEVPRS